MKWAYWTVLFLSLVFLTSIVYEGKPEVPPKGVSYFDYCTKLVMGTFFDKCLFGDHQQEI